MTAARRWPCCCVDAALKTGGDWIFPRRVSAFRQGRQYDRAGDSGKCAYLCGGRRFLDWRDRARRPVVLFGLCRQRNLGVEERSA